MRAAVAEDAVTGTEMARNEALSRALVDIAHVSRVSLSFFPHEPVDLCVIFVLFLDLDVFCNHFGAYFKNKILKPIAFLYFTFTDTRSISGSQYQAALPQPGERCERTGTNLLWIVHFLSVCNYYNVLIFFFTLPTFSVCLQISTAQCKMIFLFTNYSHFILLPQGATAEQIAAMDTTERYSAFAAEVRAEAELLVKLTLLFQDIVDKENSKSTQSTATDGHSLQNENEVVTTTPVNMTTSDGATITGSVTTTETHANEHTLVVTPLEVQNKLDSLDEQAKVLGNPPIVRKELV